MRRETKLHEYAGFFVHLQYSLFIMLFSMFQVIYSKYTDLVPKEVMNVDDPDLQRPDEEAVREVLWSVMHLTIEATCISSKCLM